MFQRYINIARYMLQYLKRGLLAAFVWTEPDVLYLSMFSKWDLISTIHVLPSDLSYLREREKQKELHTIKSPLLKKLSRHFGLSSFTSVTPIHIGRSLLL